MGAKFAAWVGITVSALLFLASAVGAIAIWEAGMYQYASADACREELYENVASQYAVRALDYMESGEDFNFPDAKNFHYGIIKAENIDDIDLNNKDIYVASNFKGEVDEDPERFYKLCYEIGDATWFSYSGTVLGGASVGSGVQEYVSNEPIYQVVYNMSDGIFYYETSGAFYPVQVVVLTCPYAEGTKKYTFVYDFKKKMYRNARAVAVDETTTAMAEENVQETADEMIEETASMVYDVSLDSSYLIDSKVLDDVLQSEYLTFGALEDAGWPKEEWGELLLDGKPYLCDGDSIWIVDEGYLEDRVIAEETDYEVGANDILCVTHHGDDSDKQTYWVVVEKPMDVELGYSSDLFVQANTFVTFAYGLRYVVYVILFAALALGIFFFVFLLNAAGHRRDTDEIVTTWIDRMPFDVYLGFAGLALLALFFCMIQFSYYGSDLPTIVMFVTLFVAAGWVLLLSFLTFAVRIKCGKWWKNTVCFWILHGIYRVLQTILTNLALLWKAILVIGALSLVEFLVVSWDGIGRITMFWFFEKIILVPLFLLAIVQMQKLKSGAERMAEGDLEHHIDTQRMFWEFRWHGENLNSISTGMSRAVDERMKSERFKTELITNVSHDIKTPLTSIINYVDLLEKEDLKNEKAEEYLEVLERQSARLKKLIEDLMEASKASTGNLAVHLEQLEADVSVVQIVGEFEEKLEASELKLLIGKPEEPIYILADSRHFWRVVDNLMNNICKYAQPGTRVYVNLERNGDAAVLTFRNTSKYPLNISSEELMERFVRGDSSRNTEGSGLGLSIAKSLMELMGGTFELYVDGDLFKVVLRFPLSNLTEETAQEIDKR